MKIDLLNDPTMEAMGNYLGRLARRQELVASNIANIDTPGYRTKDVSFHATMDELLGPESAPSRIRRPERAGIDSWVFGPPQPAVFEVQGLALRPDGNNVSIDKEMLKLGETSFGYSMIAQILRGRFRTISTSINEGRLGG